MNIRNTARSREGYKDLKKVALAERTLNAAAHPFRLQLIEYLELGELYTAQKLAINCNMPLDRTIQHLKILIRYQLIDFLRIGQFEYYRLNQRGYERIMNSSEIYNDFTDLD